MRFSSSIAIDGVPSPSYLRRERQSDAVPMRCDGVFHAFSLLVDSLLPNGPGVQRRRPLPTRRPIVPRVARSHGAAVASRHSIADREIPSGLRPLLGKRMSEKTLPHPPGISASGGSLRVEGDACPRSVRVRPRDPIEATSSTGCAWTPAVATMVELDRCAFAKVRAPCF